MMEATPIVHAPARSRGAISNLAKVPDVPPPEPLVRVRRVERAAWLAAGAALVALGVRRKRVAERAVLIALGGLSAYRAARGTFPLSRRTSSTRQREAEGRVVRVHAEATIDASPADVYHVWRRFERLPNFMTHVEAVADSPSGVSTWVLRTPLKTEVKLVARMVHDRTGELIAWESVHDSDIANDGRVRFEPAPGGRGTEVRVTLGYVPPAGKVGAAVLKLVGQDPAALIGDELRRVKQLLETGEVVTTHGQPTGARSHWRSP